MATILRLALAQPNVTVGDLDGNTAKLSEFLTRAREQGAELVVFPELALTGYPPEDLLLKPQFLRDAQTALRKLLPATKELIAVVGVTETDSRSHLYNAAAVLADRRLVGMYHKWCLPNYGVFDERRYFHPGDQAPVFQWGEVRWGVTICEDLWQPEQSPIPAQAKAGAGCLINISASPYHAGKHDERRKLAERWVKHTGLPVAYVNLVGGQDELVFDGGSFVLDGRGRCLARAKACEEDLLVLDVTVPSRPTGAPTRPFQARRGVRQAPVVAVQFRQPMRQRQLALGKPRVEPIKPLMEEIYAALVLGTRDYVRKNGFKKALIGLSGGIDSALVAAIAVDALGSEHVVGLTMPARYSSPGTRRDAQVVAQRLGIQLLSIPIEPLAQNYLATLQEVFRGTKPDVTEQNLQARIRGNLLMALSNKFGYLVLTTGNKSEFATGYCTLYGDMAGGFAVIKDVPKTWVYALAAMRNARATEPVIPETIMERAPSAELAPNQTDQDTLPPYETLDTIIEAYVEKDQYVGALVKQGLDPQTVQRTVEMIDRAEYKRRQGPPGIKITPKAFGKDRRMPITNRYHDTATRVSAKPNQPAPTLRAGPATA